MLRKRRPIRLSCCLALFLLLPSHLTLGQSAEAPDSLWIKAVVIATANHDWYPSRWHELETVFDKRGKEEETTEYHLQLEEMIGGDIDVQVIAARHNGKDILSIARQEFLEIRDDLESEQPEDNPFSTHLQHTITSSRSGTVEHIDGRAHVWFDYVQMTPKGKWVGTALLDAETGWPIRFETSPVDDFMLEEDVEITALKAVTQFSDPSSGKWVALHVQIDADFTASFLLFSFKGFSRTTITLSDYRKMRNVNSNHQGSDSSSQKEWRDDK